MLDEGTCTVEAVPVVNVDEHKSLHEHRTKSESTVPPSGLNVELSSRPLSVPTDGELTEAPHWRSVPIRQAVQ